MKLSDLRTSSVHTKSNCPYVSAATDSADGDDVADAAAVVVVVDDVDAGDGDENDVDDDGVFGDHPHRWKYSHYWRLMQLQPGQL